MNAQDQQLEKALDEDLKEFFQYAGRTFPGNSIMQRIKAILYFEPEAMSLADIAQKSGYSLSATSTALKTMEELGVVQRRKKPRSRKLHYYMHKDMGLFMSQFIKKAIEGIERAQNLAPPLLEKYKNKIAKSKSEYLKEKFDIIKAYQKQLAGMHELFVRHIEALEKQKGTL